MYGVETDSTTAFFSRSGPTLRDARSSVSRGSSRHGASAVIQSSSGE